MDSSSDQLHCQIALEKEKDQLRKTEQQKAEIR